METVVELLERARIAGLTQNQIAAAIGVTDRTVRRWAAGELDIRMTMYERLLNLLQERPQPQ
jgi:transcriptional regulator with XRE-family HTH domain